MADANKTPSYQEERIKRLDAAIAHWESLTARLDGERKLIEDTLRELRARRQALA